MGQGCWVWTDARDEELKRRWINNETSQEIAAAIFGDAAERHWKGVRARARQLGLPPRKAGWQNALRRVARAPKPRAPAPTSYWSAEGRVDDLKRLVAEGLSASQIASRLPREGALPTRNSVISKCDRLGLMVGKGNRGRNMRSRRVPNTAGKKKLTGWGHLDVNAPGWGRSRTRRDRLERRLEDLERAATELVETAYDAACPRVKPEELEPAHCRWPLGRVEDWRNFRHCGHKRIQGSSYCEVHAARAGGRVLVHAARTPAQVDPQPVAGEMLAVA